MDSSPLLSLFILLTFSCIPPTHSDPSALTSTPIPSPSPPSQPPPPPTSSQASFSKLRPSVVVIVTILSSLVGITFILLLYARHCSYNGGPPGSYPSAPMVWRKNSGIDRAVVESLPVFRFTSLKGKKEGLECAVCLVRFEPTEVLRLLPKCGHAFHVECIDTWLDAHSTCPLCRYRVDPEDILTPGRDVIISIGHNDHDRDASASATATASASTSVSPAAAGRTRRVSGRHSFAGERERAFGDSIRTVFTFWRSFNGNGVTMSRKDGMLRMASDEEEDRLRRKMRAADRKVEHRIVVSDWKGMNERWSDIQPSDLLYLESRMMMLSDGNHRIGGRSSGEEDERRRVMITRSTSAMAGIGRHDNWVGEAPPAPATASRSRSSSGDENGNVV